MWGLFFEFVRGVVRLGGSNSIICDLDKEVSWYLGKGEVLRDFWKVDGNSNLRP